MATNFATASFSEVYDLQTQAQNPTIVGVHTPRSANPSIMLAGFFRQFRKFRYKGCKMTLIPTSTLPADPLQVSYEAGEPTIDPRDMVNPILYKGCHGEDLGTILNSAMNYSDYRGPSIDVDRLSGDWASDFENFYYQLLSDASWGKAHVQRGFSKSMYPLVYKLATTKPINPTVVSTDDPDGMQVPEFNEGAYPTAYQTSGGTADALTSTVNMGAAWDSVNGRAASYEFVSPGMQRLGWMDTSQVMHSTGQAQANANGGGYITQLPKLFMLMIVLPPAYKTEFYFRVVLKHYYEFKDFRSAPPTILGYAVNAGNYYVDPDTLNPTPSTESLSLDEGTMDVINGDTKLVSCGVM